MKSFIVPKFATKNQFAEFILDHQQRIKSFCEGLKSTFNSNFNLVNPEIYDESERELFEIFRKKNILSNEEIFTLFLAAVAGPQLTITKTELDDFKRNFGDQYKPKQQPGGLFYTELEVLWSAFKVKATEGIGAADVRNLALKFIHRYDASSKRWFLTVQKFLLKPANPQTPTLRVLIDQDKFFDILTNETLKDTDKKTLTKDGSGDYYDATYFKEVNDSSGVEIDYKTHVNGSTFSFEEIQQLFCDNLADENGANRNPADFTIKFSSITSDYGSVVPGSTYVKWPHTICIYVSHKGYPQLDDSNTIVTNIFRHRGADYDTLCPPGCQIYIWPPLLNVKLPC